MKHIDQGTYKMTVMNLSYSSKSLPLILIKKSGNYPILMKFTEFNYSWTNFIMCMLSYQNLIKHL